MQNVFLIDNLNDMSSPILWENIIILSLLNSAFIILWAISAELLGQNDDIFLSFHRKLTLTFHVK